MTLPGDGSLFRGTAAQTDDKQWINLVKCMEKWSLCSTNLHQNTRVKYMPYINILTQRNDCSIRLTCIRKHALNTCLLLIFQHREMITLFNLRWITCIASIFWSGLFVRCWATKALCTSAHFQNTIHHPQRNTLTLPYCLQSYECIQDQDSDHFTPCTYCTWYSKQHHTNALSCVLLQHTPKKKKTQ